MRYAIKSESSPRKESTIFRNLTLLPYLQKPLAEILSGWNPSKAERALPSVPLSRTTSPDLSLRALENQAAFAAKENNAPRGSGRMSGE